MASTTRPPTRARNRALLAGLGVCVLLVLAGILLLIESSNKSARTPFRFFAPTSFWNTPLANNAPLDPTSPRLMTHLNQEIAQEEAGQYGPNLNTNQYSVPIYTVGAGQSTVPVILDTKDPLLSAALRAVPLPSNAHPAFGTDALLVVWQPSTDKMWEFWQLHRRPDGWHATWAGAMRNVQQSNGVFTAASWPGAQYFWGAAATSLPEVGGLITLADLQRHQIDHVLQFGIPDPREHVWSLPAERTDGVNTNPASLPEGARLRLDPTLNLAALHLPPVTLEIARAAQRYGLIVHDTSGVISLYAQDATPTGADPYDGPKGFFGGLDARQVLKAFPWSHLQVLKLDLHGVGWNP